MLSKISAGLKLLGKQIYREASCFAFKDFPFSSISTFLFSTNPFMNFSVYFLKTRYPISTFFSLRIYKYNDIQQFLSKRTVLFYFSKDSFFSNYMVPFEPSFFCSIFLLELTKLKCEKDKSFLSTFSLFDSKFCLLFIILPTVFLNFPLLVKLIDGCLSFLSLPIPNYGFSLISLIETLLFPLFSLLFS